MMVQRHGLQKMFEYILPQLRAGMYSLKTVLSCRNHVGVQ